MYRCMSTYKMAELNVLDRQKVLLVSSFEYSQLQPVPYHASNTNMYIHCRIILWIHSYTYVHLLPFYPSNTIVYKSIVVSSFEYNRVQKYCRIILRIQSCTKVLPFHPSNTIVYIHRRIMLQIHSCTSNALATHFCFLHFNFAQFYFAKLFDTFQECQIEAALELRIGEMPSNERSELTNLSWARCWIKFWNGNQFRQQSLNHFYIAWDFQLTV
jgi:hypothetical protein